MGSPGRGEKTRLCQSGRFVAPNELAYGMLVLDLASSLERVAFGAGTLLTRR